MAYPASYRFTKDHEWVAMEGAEGTIGITDFAQQQLGDVVFVELPAPGAALRAGEAFGTVESVKAVSEIFAPVSGTVTAINTQLATQPELINQDPHRAAWLVKVTVSDPGAVAQLMDAAQYEQFVSEEAH